MTDRAAPEDVAAAWCTTFFEEMVRGGVRRVVICPGSRSTPLALAAAAEPGLTVDVRLDERSAGFTALGMALATGRPAVVVVTSGTAAAELHAAVVEADLARVPLVVVTADRPPELRDVGAPQTIDQNGLYGSAVRWFCDPGVPISATRSIWRSVASRVVATAAGAGVGSVGPGPVQVNVPFREPLVGHADRVGLPPGRSDGAPWHLVDTSTVAGDLDDTVRGVVTTARGLVVVGALPPEPLAREAVAAFASHLGWPVLAEPRSGLASSSGVVDGVARGAFGGATVVTTTELVLRSDRFAAAHRPEAIVRIGPPWASKVVNGFVARAARDGAHLVVVDPWDHWVDPEAAADIVVRADVASWCRAFLGASGEAAAPGRWLAEWAAADEAAQEVLAVELAPGAPLTEPALARRLTAVLPDEATLVVASSMPVRDVECFADRSRPLRVVANRGANGIDGVVSTALGVALASGRPTVALVGDLAFLHDVSALVAVAQLEVPLTVVVADNGGGGIFSFLDQAEALPTDTFERLFGTPSGTDVAAVVRGFGCPLDEVGGPDGRDVAGGDLEEVVRRHLAGSRCSVVRVQVPDRTANVRIHRRLAEEVARQMPVEG